MKQEITKVLFLIEKNELGYNGEIPFAYFPEERYSDAIPNARYSYAHIGQHSPCTIHYAESCKEATPEQYKDLKAELESIGYNLKVLNQ